MKILRWRMLLMSRIGVPEVVSAAFAILAKYRQSGGWFYVSDEIAVAAIATAAFRTGGLIVQVPFSVVRQITIATSVPLGQASAISSAPERYCS